MFNHKCLGVVLVVVVLLAGVAGGLANPSQITAAKVETALNPWKVEMLEQDSLARDLSIVMGGLHQYPLISFTNPDPHLDIDRIMLAVPALGEPGNFGPDNNWKLFTFPPAAKKGTVSAAVTRAMADSFIIGWAYQGRFDNNIYVHYRELDNHLNFLTEHYIKIIDWEQLFGGLFDLLGKPSLSFDGNWMPHLAVSLGFNYGPDTKIMYAYHNPMGLTNPCGDESSGYQCDTITYQGLYDYLRAPILNLDASGFPRIAYREGSNLMYAYPESRPIMLPNCGPGGNTWRCIEIAGGYEGTAGAVFSMSKSPGAPHLAYTFHDGPEVWLYSARYVGSGGNCGEDYRFGIPPVLENRWQCEMLSYFGLSPLYTSLSIGVDQENFPVIAFNKPEGPFFNLSVAFPAERSGKDPNSGNCGPGSTWECIKVDGKGINTGRNVALALKDDGRGFIVYIEDEEYSPNLKLAYQQIYVFLPMVIR